jgi:4-hydroxy-tetrahydrodipicolinate synthase
MFREHSQRIPGHIHIGSGFQFAGDIKGAAKLQLELLPLINALFSEVNPIPVKSAMAAMGFCDEFLRSPLTIMEEPRRSVLLNEMKKQGIIIK